MCTLLSMDDSPTLPGVIVTAVVVMKLHAWRPEALSLSWKSGSRYLPIVVSILVVLSTAGVNSVADADEKGGISSLSITANSFRNHTRPVALGSFAQLCQLSHVYG